MVPIYHIQFPIAPVIWEWTHHRGSFFRVCTKSWKAGKCLILTVMFLRLGICLNWNILLEQCLIFNIILCFIYTVTHVNQYLLIFQMKQSCHHICCLLASHTRHGAELDWLTWASEWKGGVFPSHPASWGWPSDLRMCARPLTFDIVHACTLKVAS